MFPTTLKIYQQNQRNLLQKINTKKYQNRELKPLSIKYYINVQSYPHYNVDTFNLEHNEIRIVRNHDFKNTNDYKNHCHDVFEQPISNIRKSNER